MTKQSEILNDPMYRTVLDHGFIGLVDSMGDDDTIVRSARVSYGKGTKKVSEDRGLIRYLLRHAHMTPFEMVQFTFHMKLPIFVARQLVRHRTAKINEYSARYSILDKEYYIPEANVIAPQAKDNKQGRSGELTSDQAERVRELLITDAEHAYDHYETLLGNKTDNHRHYDANNDQLLKDENFTGIARELARMDLPVNYYTQWYWSCDFRNLMNFLRLRLDPHAQYEIRVYAQAMYDLIKDKVPLAMEAFDDYVLNAKTLSRMEMDLLKSLTASAETLYDSYVGHVEEVFNSEKELADAYQMSMRELEDFKKTWDIRYVSKT